MDQFQRERSTETEMGERREKEQTLRNSVIIIPENMFCTVLTAVKTLPLTGIQPLIDMMYCGKFSPPGYGPAKQASGFHMYYTARSMKQ